MELLMLADLASLNGGGDGRPQPQQLKESGPPGSVHDYLDCGTEFLATHDYYDRVPAAEFDFDHSYAFHISHASVVAASREWNDEDCLPNNDCIAPNLPSNEEVIDAVIERAAMDKKIGNKSERRWTIGNKKKSRNVD